MGDINAVEAPIYWGIMGGTELLGVGVTNPGEQTTSGKEFIVSDTEAGLIAQLATHGVTEAEYLAMKEGN